jgi:putative transposase
MLTGLIIVKKKRHSPHEVASKLAQADELAQQGKLQREIARTLGVSVMTLHRWRKDPPSTAVSTHATSLDGPADPPKSVAATRSIGDLQNENAQLRRLVADLMLEKLALMEGAQPPTGRGRGRRRA